MAIFNSKLLNYQRDPEGIWDVSGIYVRITRSRRSNSSDVIPGDLEFPVPNMDHEIAAPCIWNMVI